MFIDLKVMQKRTTINVSKSNKKEFSLMPGHRNYIYSGVHNKIRNHEKW